MSRKSKKQSVRLIKANNKQPIHKSLRSENISDTIETNIAQADGILSPPFPIAELLALSGMSTILQQCVDAYKRNIVGFGATPAYIKDDVADGSETPEMIREWDTVRDFIAYFSFDQSFTDVWGTLIDDREMCGNAYLEIVRDGTGAPVGGDRVKPDTIQLTKLGDYVDVEVKIAGKTYKRPKRFRKFVQEVGGAKVFYKEFGDPRTMNMRTGAYEEVEEQEQANEIIHLKIGSDTYGVPRWIGQLIHIYGARKAEELNYKYFYQGRHTPMAIVLSNAELSEKSEAQLQEYADTIEGVENAHKFIIIEADGLEEGETGDEKKNGKIEIKSLADMLQQDALFLDYDKASREKVQSSFRLPDIYLGRTKDFNRSTSDTARSITEEQVFDPERNSLEWILNNKILVWWELKEARLDFKKPEISDYETLAKVLDILIKGGGVAPNDLRELLGKLIGKTCEPFPDEIFNIPLAAVPIIKQLEQQATQMQQGAQQPNGSPLPLEKAEMNNLLKDVRDILQEQYSQLEKVNNSA